jgi:hypothetical protein
MMVITKDHIKVQLVQTGQKISKKSQNNFKEVRHIKVTNGEGVRVDYFDGGIDWFPVSALVFVLR